MNKLFALKTTASNKEGGFTTFEVLISLLIALGFVAVSMQSLVYAMAMKVQAQEKQRANELIQEDIERINRLGSVLTTGTGGAVPMCNATNYDDGLAKALWDDINAAGTQTKTIIKKINSDGSVGTGGKQIALERTHVSNTSSTAPHRTLKVGYQVWNWNGGYTDENGGTIVTGDEPIAETYVEIIPDVALQCP